MSLLNEALRKKHIEQDGLSKKNGYFPHELKTEKKGKKRTCSIVLLTVFISLLGAGSILYLFNRFLSDSGVLFSIDKGLLKNTCENKVIRSKEQLKMVQEQRAVRGEAPDTTMSKLQIKQNEQSKTSRQFQPLTDGPVYKSNPSPKINAEAMRNKKVEKVSMTRNVNIERHESDLLFQKALIFHRRNKLEDAARIYRQVILNKPEHVEALFNLASIYIKTGSFQKACPVLEKLRGLDFENQKILLYLAIVEIGKGNPKRALSYLDMAENRSGDLQFEIFFHRGVANSRMDDLNNAIFWYKKAEQLQPLNDSLIFNSALAYDKMQSYDEAVKYYSLCLQQKDVAMDEKKMIEARIKGTENFSGEKHIQRRLKKY